MTDMKNRIAVRGWMGLMALGAVLMAPQALAQTCEDKCSISAASTFQACGKKCNGKDLVCPDSCTRKFETQKAKCIKRCPKGAKGKAAHEGHAHDDEHHDE